MLNLVEEAVDDLVREGFDSADLEAGVVSDNASRGSFCLETQTVAR